METSKHRALTRWQNQALNVQKTLKVRIKLGQITLIELSIWMDLYEKKKSSLSSVSLLSCGKHSIPWFQLQVWMPSPSANKSQNFKAGHSEGEALSIGKDVQNYLGTLWDRQRTKHFSAIYMERNRQPYFCSGISSHLLFTFQLFRLQYWVFSAQSKVTPEQVCHVKWTKQRPCVWSCH